ncbi:MAG: hypothetical protein IPH09_07115 [bacterium]|nr:hypothetical protein [bacterium]
MSRQQSRRRRAEAFIFDLDGTLVDSGRDLAVSANFVRARFGLPELPEPVVVSFVGDGVGKLVERALADLGDRRPPSASPRAWASSWTTTTATASTTAACTRACWRRCAGSPTSR